MRRDRIAIQSPPGPDRPDHPVSRRWRGTLAGLAGAALVQVNADARTRYVAEEIASLRASVEQLAAQTSAVAVPSNDGTIEAMLALQDRMKRLETEWAERPAQTAAAPLATAPGNNAFATGVGAAPAAVDPSWPTTNCIPMGTRFIASLGDEIGDLRDAGADQGQRDHRRQRHDRRHRRDHRNRLPQSARDQLHAHSILCGRRRVCRNAGQLPLVSDRTDEG